MSVPTVADLLRDAARRLRAAGIDAGDARHLVAAALTLPPDRLVLHMADPVTPGQCAAVAAAIDRRVAGVPVSRITGRRAFWGRDFAVTPAVLDPRPETETLVALALARPFATVLDLGTGSGCILVSLLAAQPDAAGTGTDISDAALATARANAAAHGADRARFLLSDWFAGVTGRYDLIVSNPPYIAADEISALSPEVRDHDPRIALSPGGDGLDAYRAIAAGARRHLSPGGRLLVEIGPTQAAAVRALLFAGGLTDLAVHSDLDGRDRVVSARAGGGAPESGL